MKIITSLYTLVFLLIMFSSCVKDSEQIISPREINDNKQQLRIKKPPIKEAGVKAKFYLYRQSTNCVSGFAICKIKALPYVKPKISGYVYIPNNFEMYLRLDNSYTLPNQSMTFESGEDCHPEIDEPILSYFGFSNLEILPGTYQFVTDSNGYHEILINISAQ
jgi:hypothetical protein